jgi:hypothetical protein
VSADETGIYWAPQLKYMYVPKDADRAAAHEGDESGRFTAMLGANAEEQSAMMPLMQIVKVKCKSPTDLSASTTLKKYLTDGTCPAADGWTLGLYEKTLGDKQYKRPYLINSNTLDLITVQPRAWNDSVGMLMHIELQMQPFRLKMNALHQVLPETKHAIIVDNVGSHCTDEVKTAWEAAGWLIGYLPPNMTDRLQPMDLIVNAVCKLFLRNWRMCVHRLFLFFLEQASHSGSFHRPRCSPFAVLRFSRHCASTRWPWALYSCTI